MKQPNISYLMCTKCQATGCTAKPESGTFCSGFHKPVWNKPNTLFENVVHKSPQQAERVLTLLHNHQISWQRYSNKGGK